VVRQCGAEARERSCARGRPCNRVLHCEHHTTTRRPFNDNDTTTRRPFNDNDTTTRRPYPGAGPARPHTRRLQTTQTATTTRPSYSFLRCWKENSSPVPPALAVFGQEPPGGDRGPSRSLLPTLPSLLSARMRESAVSSAAWRLGNRWGSDVGRRVCWLNGKLVDLGTDGDCLLFHYGTGLAVC